MVRVCPVKVDHGTWLSCNVQSRQITICGDPSFLASCQLETTVPKKFTLDAVFPEQSSLAEVCSTSLTDLLQAVVLGSNGCIYCYGHAGLGKTYTMLGIDDSRENLGVIPCAISWIYNLINEQVEKTASKFSVRVSAIEVTGKEGTVRDLLTDVSTEKESNENTGSTVYFREDPVGGVRIENQKELRAPTAQHAAYYLDAAIAARTVPDVNEDSSHSHFRFTLHIYQYRIGRISRSHNKVIGGRSQLHFLDLGNCSSQGRDGCYSISTLGTVLLATLSGQRHMPHKENRVTQLVRGSMNGSCHTCMIAHVSPSIQFFSETLQVLQLASKICRLKPKKSSKLSSTSSDDSSHEEYLTSEQMHSSFYTRATEVRSSSDPEFISSSEQSCDTVIFVGKGRRTSGNKKTISGNTLATKDILKVPDDLNFSDDQTKPDESPILDQSLSASTVKSSKAQNQIAEIMEHAEVGSQFCLNKGSEMPSNLTCSNPSQLTGFEFEPYKRVAAMPGCSKKFVDVRHDPLGDESHQDFEESAVSNSQSCDKLTSCISSVSEQVRCRVRKRHHLLHSNLVKQNELWVDGPNAVVIAQNSKDNENATDGVREVECIKPVIISSVHSARKSMQLTKEEEAGQATHAAVGYPKEAAAIKCCNLEASAKQATGSVMCSRGVTMKQIEAIKRRSEEATENTEESCKPEEQLLLQSKGSAVQAKVAGLSDETPKRGTGVQGSSEIRAEFGPREIFSEIPASCRHFDSVKLGCQEENASLMRKKYLLRALSEVPAAEAHLTEIGHHSSPREDREVHGMLKQPVLDVDPSDRTAQWVKNIQEASTSRFVQLLHSRKELLRSFRVRRNSHSMSKAPTMDFIKSCQILATFDEPVDVGHENRTDNNSSDSVCESPTAGTKSVLDINENEARIHEGDRRDCQPQRSDVKSVMTTYTNCLLRPGEISLTKRDIDCGGDWKSKSGSGKRALKECLLGSLLFCGQSSTALDKDEVLHHFEDRAKDVGRFDKSSCIVRLSQPDGASNPNLMDELCEPFSSKELPIMQNLNNLQPTPSDHQKSSSNLFIRQEKLDQAFHLDSRDRNAEEHIWFSRLHSSTSFIHSKATFPCNLNDRQRSESVDCNMPVNASSGFPLSSPKLLQQRSMICLKSNSLQLANCDNVESLCSAKSSPGDVAACSPKSVSASSCHFTFKTNSGSQENEVTSTSCLCEVPRSFAALEIESFNGSRHEDCMQRTGSSASTVSLHLSPSLDGNTFSCSHDRLSVQEVGRIKEIPNQEEVTLEANEDVTWLPNTYEKMTLDKRLHRVQVLLNEQERLKEELAMVKDVLMIDRNCWSHDGHMAEPMDCISDPNYLEAVERKNSILKKHVNACKSRIMVITVFDITS